MNLQFKIAHIIGTVFYVGKLPIAPGTWGSLAALISWFIIKPKISDPLFLLITGGIFFIGIASSEIIINNTGKKDPKAASTGGEPPTNPQGLKPKYGAQIRNTVLVGANEEAGQCDDCGKPVHEGACSTKDEGYKGKEKKVKKEEIDIMDTQEWKDAAKKQTSRIMDIWKKTH